MEYYFAPLESITGAIYRRVHHRHFPGAAKYYIPFFSPTREHLFTARALRELAPARNEGVPAIPQLMTRSAEDFLWAAGELQKMGYGEVNLNLGCPSGTVTAKGKGAGFLAQREELDRFLGEIFEATPLPITVKTRLGIAETEEFSALLAIYNRYPIAQLTVHPRVQKDFYRFPIRPEAFAEAVRESRNPLCYNGNLVTRADCAALSAAYPALPAAMLGRGLIANPSLLRRVQGGAAADKGELREFLEDLTEEYRREYHSDTNALFRLRELWFYLIHLFGDSEGYAKKIKRVSDFAAYRALVEGIFRDLPLLEETDANW